MSRSIRSRRNSRQGVRLAQIRSGRKRTRKPIRTAQWSSRSAARVIGLPLDVTLPRLKGIRWRYCTRWDEGPAAVLGTSLLRLGICRPNDWSGSAVDFVERGFRRFCSQNRAVDVKRVWVGDLRITDSLFELTEQERNQVEAGREGMTDHLYLVGDYEAAASIPIGATSRASKRRTISFQPPFIKSSPPISTNGCACTTTSMPRSTLRCGWRI